jgi:hypothetical protein
VVVQMISENLHRGIFFFSVKDNSEYRILLVSASI